jgi:hypothetical protein
LLLEEMKQRKFETLDALHRHIDKMNEDFGCSLEHKPRALGLTRTKKVITLRCTLLDCPFECRFTPRSPYFLTAFPSEWHSLQAHRS